jgi:hypothetical protein
MPPNADLTCLNDLIAGLGSADLGTQTESPSGLLLEHLQSARRSVIGSMRAEYSSNLEQAKDSLACIPNHSHRTAITKALRGLIDSQALTRRPSASPR